MISRLSLADLAAYGSHQKGHFRLSSGLHSSDYLQCALYLANPVRAERAGQDLAKTISSVMVDPSVIVAPAMGQALLIIMIYQIYLLYRLYRHICMKI